MTEQKARSLWCPMARVGRNVQVRGIDLFSDATRCIASKCMIWRWADITSKIIDGKEVDTSSGYCGLGGRI